MNKKIYIIEDDANIVYGLQAKFSSLGMAVETNTDPENVESALRAITISRPDYIVLDIILPRVDGLDILTAVKSNEEIFGIPVFVFADLSTEQVKQRTMNLGADHYFIKEEFNIDQFVDKVVKIIQNRDKEAGNESSSNDILKL